jgi:hypothetical protein
LPRISIKGVLATVMIVAVTKAIAAIIVVATMIEAETIITTNIVDIGQSPVMPTISMITSEITIITGTGLHGSRGNTTKKGTPTMCDMATTKGIITNCSFCSMTV